MEPVVDVERELSLGDKPVDIPDETLITLYKSMVLLRQFDRRAVSLQRQGRIGTYPPLEGQEGCQVAATMALRKQDFIFPTYRDYGAMMQHGVPMENILLYWNGRVEGCEIPKEVNVFPMAVPIATQLPHATGAAWAAKLRKIDQISLAFFGDGASSEGDFHEAMNFAGVFEIPVIFFCQNNLYAISVPFSRQTATETIAEKASAYGVQGIRVDGSNAIDVFRAVQGAVLRATRGLGPTLIEALTYRYGAHTTSDDPGKYRPLQEAEAWRKRDPIKRLKLELTKWGIWNETFDAIWKVEVDNRILTAIQVMEAVSPPSLDDMFLHVYEQITPRLKGQREDLQASLSWRLGEEGKNDETHSGSGN
jgi:pyruvate dehydrogenase E1 component alpha subunit